MPTLRELAQRKWFLETHLRSRSFWGSINTPLIEELSYIEEVIRYKQDSLRKELQHAARLQQNYGSNNRTPR